MLLVILHRSLNPVIDIIKHEWQTVKQWQIVTTSMFSLNHV